MNRDVNRDVSETQFGFDWGLVCVERWACDERAGYWISVSSLRDPRQRIIIRVTPAGAKVEVSEGA